MMAPGNKVHFLPHFSVRTSSSGRATDADRDACTVPGAAAAAALPHSSFSSSPLVLPQTQLAPYSKGTWPYTGSHLCDKVSDVTQGTCFGSQFVVSSLGWTASRFKVPEKKRKIRHDEAKLSLHGDQEAGDKAHLGSTCLEQPTSSTRRPTHLQPSNQHSINWSPCSLPGSSVYSHTCSTQPQGTFQAQITRDQMRLPESLCAIERPLCCACSF